MGKFAQICSGERPRKRDVSFMTLSGREAKCDLELVDGDEYLTCLAAATAVAKKAGAEPVEGNAVYDFALACEIVARAGRDPDAPKERYFDDVEQVRKNLDSERVLFLFRMHEILQDESAPQLRGPMTVEEAVREMVEAAIVKEGDELPFERWRPVSQRTWVRFLVDRAMLVTDDKSLSTSAFSASSTTSSLT
jgi:hypothetical protein